MIGITTLSSGRMGNRLFHYHYMRQLCQKLNQDYFFPGSAESAYFFGMERRRRPFKVWRNDYRITRNEVLTHTSGEVLAEVEQQLAWGRDVVLVPPVLGEAFFDYLFFAPSDFIIVRPEYRLPLSVGQDGSQVVGVHFRGTDFKAWNPRASLSFEYYRRAIDYCLEQESGHATLVFHLFTDDFHFPPYIETTRYLQSMRADFACSPAGIVPIVDFYRMSQCAILISSPSTFAILAGATGVTKRIIHSQDWLEYAVGRQDRFWVRLLETDNPYYSLWKAV